MSALTITGLSMRFEPGRPVLDDVALAVADQTMLSVLGPSGCGKTTLLRLIAGFLRPEAGTIAIAGQTVTGDRAWVPSQRRRVGYVAQEGALFPHLDVAANVAFGLPRAQRRARSRVRELLALVELDEDLMDRYPHQLSGGQQQRVALARTLAPRPSLVLLDEPFAALDAHLRVQTGRAVLRALRAAEATAILVTHDQAEALSLTDAVAVMRDGRIAQVGAPANVYAAPGDLGIAGFVGEAIILPAHVADGRAHCALGSLTATGSVAAGPAQVLIRPEHLILDAPDGVPAHVRDVTFYGHDAVVDLDLGPDDVRLSARVVGSPAPAPGSRVSIGVHGPVRTFPAAA